MTHFIIGFNGLPFIPDQKQIIYVENAYDKKANRFIKYHYKRICLHFAQRGYEFCYLPLLHKKLNKEVQTYYNPATKRQTDIPIGSDFLLQFMAHPENRPNIQPSLLYVKKNIVGLGGEELCLRGLTLGKLSWSNRKLSNELSAIISDTYRTHKPSTIRYRTVRKVAEKPAEGKDQSGLIAEISVDDKDNSEQTIERPFDRGIRMSLRGIADGCSATFFGEELRDADERFDEDIRHLLSEVEERINALKQKGVSLYVLERMLQEPVKLSRMVITSDYRILLPDYQNMEIEMTPLVKAVYVLFLRHPEGIIFKHLPDYQVELMDIYKKIKGEPLDEKMIRSVQDVTDPTKNSINEKCARIREAFVGRFDERLAVNYVVRGERGAPKLISLPRELVEWQ